MKVGWGGPVDIAKEDYYMGISEKELLKGFLQNQQKTITKYLPTDTYANVWKHLIITDVFTGNTSKYKFNWESFGNN